VLWRWGISLYGSCERNLEGGAPLLTTLKDMWKRLWRQASISIGAPVGILERGSSIGDYERWMKGTPGMECLSLKRLSVEGLWGGILYWGPQKIS
jgi:hypothetical protein